MIGSYARSLYRSAAAENGNRDCTSPYRSSHDFKYCRASVLVGGRAPAEWDGTRESRRWQCRRRQTPCSFPLPQTSGNTAPRPDQTAYRSTQPDGGLLLQEEAHFDRGAKKPWRRKHRLPRRCAIPPGFLFPSIRRGSPFRHNSRGDEGCRVPRVQIQVASAAPPTHTPDASSSARIPGRPALQAFAESHRECPLYRCRG